MGTTYKVAAIDHTGDLQEGSLREAVNLALLEVNKSLSNWDSTSEISRINAAPAGRDVPLSPQLSEVMAAASDVHLASGGRFDTTIGPLIELWGFGAPGRTSLPNDAAVSAAQLKSGHGNTLKVTPGRMQKTQSDAQVYLAGIGKGYGADHVGRALEALGVQDYLVEIGGDLYASGLNGDGLPWQIGIETPMASDRRLLGVVGLSGLGLASSGDYRNFFEDGGQRFSHLIDPVTGRPVDHATASATVLAENAMLADAWSTAMLILGRERGLDIAAQHNIAVQFVERAPSASQIGFKTFASDAFRALTT